MVVDPFANLSHDFMDLQLEHQPEARASNELAYFSINFDTWLLWFGQS
jgi:hypothetical protein